MEVRGLNPEERAARVVESSSVSEVLALAHKLQAEAEGLLTEEQLFELGRELGVEPQYVREALRLRHRAAQPVREAAAMPAPVAAEERCLISVGQAFMLLASLSIVPVAMGALDDYGLIGAPFFALFAAFIVGWCARYSRLAGIAGALAVPLALVVGAFYHGGGSWNGLFHSVPTAFVALLAFGPLCWATGRGAVRLRRWLERSMRVPEREITT